MANVQDELITEPHFARQISTSGGIALTKKKSGQEPILLRLSQSRTIFICTLILYLTLTTYSTPVIYLTLVQVELRPNAGTPM